MKSFGFSVLCSVLVCSDLLEMSRGAKVCRNGGRSLSGSHLKCLCRDGYKGYDCSQKVKPCETKPCRNLATCINNKNGTFTCECAENYEGILCEKKVRPCDRKPCKNGGKCTDDGVKCFKCKCPDGYKGADCSEKISPCEVFPCMNGAACIDKKNGSFKCKCRKGYVGILCARKSALLLSVIIDGKMSYFTQLEKWLGSVKNWQLCYRASRDTFAASAFHARCDERGETVTLVRVKNFIFGGYTDISWGGGSKYKSSTKSFLFSLRNKYNLPPFKSPVYQNSGYAIYAKLSSGPTFGGGHDFYIASNANMNTNSYANLGYTYKAPRGYSYQATKTKALLAGSYNFMPSEVEVFYVD